MFIFLERKKNKLPLIGLTMTRPGSETPAPPPPGDDATTTAPAAAAISPSDPRLQRCAFAVLRGKNVHELDDGRNVNEFFVRTFDVSLGRRSRNGGADVVISGTESGKWEWETRRKRGEGERRRKKTHTEGKKKEERQKTLPSSLFSPHSLFPSPKTRRRRQHEHLEAARPDQVQL